MKDIGTAHMEEAKAQQELLSHDTHVLILQPSTSTRHTCIRVQVSTSFRGSALTEKGIMLVPVGERRDATLRRL